MVSVCFRFVESHRTVSCLPAYCRAPARKLFYHGWGIEIYSGLVSPINACFTKSFPLNEQITLSKCDGARVVWAKKPSCSTCPINHLIWHKQTKIGPQNYPFYYHLHYSTFSFSKIINIKACNQFKGITEVWTIDGWGFIILPDMLPYIMKAGMEGKGLCHIMCPPIILQDNA